MDIWSSGVQVRLLHLGIFSTTWEMSLVAEGARSTGVGGSKSMASLAGPLQRVGDGIEERNPSFPGSAEGSLEAGDHVFTKPSTCPVT